MTRAAMLTDALIAALDEKAGARLCWTARATSWRSLALLGERHALTAASDDASAIAALVDGIADHESTVPGRLVADISADAPFLSGGTSCVRLEVLTVSAD